RFAPASDSLEGDIGHWIGNAGSRGRITFTPSGERAGACGDLLLNRQAPAPVLAAPADLTGQLDDAPPSPGGSVGLRGVRDRRARPMSADAEEAVTAAIVDAAGRALADRVAARRQEGERLAAVLLERLDEIEALVARPERHPDRSRDVIL